MAVLGWESRFSFVLVGRSRMSLLDMSITCSYLLSYATLRVDMRQLQIASTPMLVAHVEVVDPVSGQKMLSDHDTGGYVEREPESVLCDVLVVLYRAGGRCLGHGRHR